MASEIILGIVVASVVAAALYVAWRYNRLGWALAGLGAVLAVVAGVLSRRRPTAVPPPPAGPSTVHHTAAELMHKRADEDRAAIEKAADEGSR